MHQTQTAYLWDDPISGQQYKFVVDTLTEEYVVGTMYSFVDGKVAEFGRPFIKLPLEDFEAQMVEWVTL